MTTNAPIEYAERQSRGARRLRRHHDHAPDRLDQQFLEGAGHDPATLRRTWEAIKQIMAPGALDPLTKEMIYVAVSATNQCRYCIASHTAAARKAGMTDAMFARADGRGRHGQRNQPPRQRLSGGDRSPISVTAPTS